MVNARSVSTVLALSCVAAPLLHATCSEQEGFPSVLDQHQDDYLHFPDEGATVDAGEVVRMGGEDADEKEQADEELHLVQEDGDINAGQDCEDCEAGGSHANGVVGDQHENVEPTPVVTTPLEEAEVKPVTEPVAEQQAEQKTSEGDAEEKEEAPVSFFGKIKKSLSKGFNALKGKLSRAPKEEEAEEKAEQEAKKQAADDV